MDMVGAGAAASARENARPVAKKLRAVFSRTAEVAAVWAAQDRPEARTGSNTWCRRATLYSYGTAIARIVPAIDDGRPVALISSGSWSSGTSKVQNEAWGAAARLGMAVYTVPQLGVSDADVSANLRYFERRIEEAVTAITKAVRWDTARSHRDGALRLIAVAHLYANDMSTDWRWAGPNPLMVRNAKEDV